MSVYVDPLFATKPNRRWPYMQACHLTADSTAELLEIAAKLKLRPQWIQKAGTVYEHFDCTAAKRRQAVALGAKEVTIKEEADRIIALRRGVS